MPTEEELELLTPEERAGLELEDDKEADADEPSDDEEQDDEGDEEGGDHDEDAGDGEEGDSEDDAEADQEGSTNADDGQPGRDDGADPDDQGGDGEDEENPDRPVIPQFTLEAPEDAEGKLKALDAGEDELNEKFDDGDISAADFRKGMREINQQRDDIKWEVRKYEQAKERHDENVAGARDQFMRNWFETAGKFVKDRPDISRNKTLMQVFDGIVQGINTEENINKFSHQKRLEMAYAQFREDLGLEPEKDAKPGKSGKPGKKAAPPKKRELPPNLGKLPSADVNETDDGSFGTLNRLFNSANPKDVAKAEDMLARMPEAEQDRYLRSN